MKKIWMVIFMGTVALAGCTTMTLNQYTLNQNRSSGEGRDRTVLNCLATLAADPDCLPSFSIYSAGATTVTDSITIGQTTTWAPLKYTLEALALTGNRSPKGQWTVDPLVEYERLAALQAACWWALYGPEKARPAHSWILGDPTVLLDNKPHFGVEERLARIPHGWVHVGKHKDVPECARFKGHQGNTWVWIMPDDTRSFAEFTLVLQDIATLDATIMTAPPLLVQLTTYELTKIPDTADAKKATTIGTTEFRAVKLGYRKEIEKAIQEGMKTGKVNLTRAQWLAYTEPWFGQRFTSSATPTITPAASLTGRSQPVILNSGLPGLLGSSTPPPPAVKFDLN